MTGWLPQFLLEHLSQTEDPDQACCEALALIATICNATYVQIKRPDLTLDNPIIVAEYGTLKDTLTYYHPLRLQGIVYGTLGIDCPPLTPDQYRILEGLTGQLALILAVHHYKLQSQRHQQELNELQELNTRQVQHFAGTSHEIRNLLNNVSVVSQLLLQKKYGVLNDQQEDFLIQILTSIKDLQRMVGDILDTASFNAAHIDVQITPIAVAPICEECLKMVEGERLAKDIVLRYFIDPHLKTVLADELRLKQMLFNLLSNAVKFTPHRGVIGLSVEETLDSQALPCVQFTVWDTGIGISKERQLDLFQPFARMPEAALYQGTGLGLWLTHKLARLHQGRILLESAPNEGSRFMLQLPSTQARPLAHGQNSLSDGHWGFVQKL